jgi:hypothetical protein
MAIGKTFIQILGPREQFPNNPGFPTIFLQKQVDTSRTVFGFNDGNGNTFTALLVLAAGTAPGTKLSRIFDVNAASPSDGDTLVYDSATEKWVNEAGGSGSSDLTINSQSGTSYTLALSDKNNLVELARATTIVLAIPANATVAFPIGSQVLAYQAAAGQVTFSALTGVNLISAGGKNKTSSSGSTASLIKVATNSWLLSGDITT